MYNRPVGIKSRVILCIGVFFLGLIAVCAQGVSGQDLDIQIQPELKRKVAVPGASPVPGINRDDPEFWIQVIKQWRIAIDRHIPGMADEAASSVGRWEEYDLLTIMKLVEGLTAEDEREYLYKAKRMLNDLEKSIVVSLLRFDEPPGSILKRGVLLHTDIALLKLEKGNKENNKGIIRVGDGLGAVQNKEWHMEYARALLSFLPSDPSRGESKRQWYISTTACLLAMQNYAQAEDNLRYALDIFTSDAAILFYVGTLHENYASPIAQNALAPSGMDFKFKSKKSELEKARSFYRKAIKADPTFYEAHLHLGRVLGLLGDHDQAVDVLQQISAFLTDSRLRYYCSIFLGKELTTLNRTEEARAQYEIAAQLYPRAPSPLLGLSRLAHIDGNNKEALLGVAMVIESPEGRNILDDPWWSYDVFHVRNAPELIWELYKEFGEQPR